MAILKAFACASLLAFVLTARPVFAQNSNDMAPAPANSAPAANPATPSTPAVKPAKQHKHRKAHAKKPAAPPASAPTPQGPDSQG